MLYLGIDPGQSGGIVAIKTGMVTKNSAKESYEFSYTNIYYYPMPSTERDVWCLFNEFCMHQAHAVIEHVHAMPHQGVTSMFTFGMGYGGLRMALVGNGIPFEEVRPQVWQKAFGIPPRRKNKGVKLPVKFPSSKARYGVKLGESKTEWKTRLLRKAQQLFPKEEISRDLADALLIAEYCRRQHTKAKE